LLSNRPEELALPHCNGPPSGWGMWAYAGGRRAHRLGLTTIQYIRGDKSTPCRHHCILHLPSKVNRSTEIKTEGHQLLTRSSCLHRSEKGLDID